MYRRLLLAASTVCVSLLFFSTTASASATPTFLQACSTSSATVTGTSVHCSLTVNVTPGDLIFVAACYYPSVTGSTASDSNGNSYVPINTNNNANGALGCTSFYAANVSASPNAKPTITVSNASSTTWWTMIALEYSGVDPTSPVDQVAAATGSSSTPSSGNLTPTQAGDLLIGVGFIGQGTMSAGTGFRQVLQTGGGGMVEDQLLASTQPVAATATATQSSNWALQAVAFRAAATGPSPAPSGPAPPSNHVAFVLLENRDYGVVEGSSSMPYLNSLMSTYAQGNAYFGNTHPSIGNYMMLTTGQIITNDDNFTGTVTADNLAREMIAASKTWKVYAQSLPYAGYLGSTAYPYEKHHNPFAYFSDVVNSTAEALNIVPFTQFPTDLNAGALPNYSFILPDDQHNGHDCPPGMSTCTEAQILSNVDNWLQTNIAPLVSNSTFQQDGILVIAWDESAADDDLFGGGHITYAVVGPGVKRGYVSNTFYQHANAERLACDALGIPCPGTGATATPQGEFFSSSEPSSAPACSLSVSPTSGVAPLGVTATGSCTDSGNDITTTTLDWGDGTTQSATSGTHTYGTVGTYTVKLTATDAQNLTGSVSQSVTVASSAPACTLSVSPSSGVAPLTVSATGSCSDAGNDIVTTTLNWGDGTSQTGTSGSHTYSNAGTYTVQLTATDALNLTGSATQTVAVSASTGSFSLSVSPTTRNVARGKSTTFSVSVTASGGFTGTVTFGVSGLPSGVAASFTPASVTTSGSSTLTLNVASTTPAGNYTLAITGTSGSVVQSVNVALRVK